MSEDDMLLAHLVPKLTPQVEDAATDALAYVLNASESCREALIDLVGDRNFRLASLESVKTQVVAGSKNEHRLDLVGYGESGAVPLIIESKFWAPLLDGQASGYLDYLTASGPSLLLFVAPVVRHAALWTKIQEQFAHDKPDVRLEPVECGPDMKAVRIADLGEHTRVALMSWTTLLNVLENADASAAPDVRQIKGLARTQDDAAFSPLHAGDFNTTIPRRIMNFNLIADDVVDARGVPQG